MSTKSAEPITANDRWIANSDGAVVGVRPARSERAEATWARLDSEGRLLDADGAVIGVASAGTPGTTLTATGTGYAAQCEFWGIEVSAYSSGPITVVVRDGGAGGAIVATFTVSGVGFYSYSGPWNAPGNGQNLSRAMSTDVHMTVSGGTGSVTPIVSPV